MSNVNVSSMATYFCIHVYILGCVYAPIINQNYLLLCICISLTCNYAWRRISDVSLFPMKFNGNTTVITEYKYDLLLRKCPGTHESQHLQLINRIESCTAFPIILAYWSAELCSYKQPTFLIVKTTNTRISLIHNSPFFILMLFSPLPLK